MSVLPRSTLELTEGIPSKPRALNFRCVLKESYNIFDDSVYTSAILIGFPQLTLLLAHAKVY